MFPVSSLKILFPRIRTFVTGTDLIYIKGSYYLKNIGSNEYKLGVTPYKFKDFKEIVYMNFTDEKEVNEGDYLFSVEDSKTLFDFNSPLSMDILEINPKFIGNSDYYQKLLTDPEDINNYLMVIKKRI